MSDLSRAIDDFVKEPTRPKPGTPCSVSVVLADAEPETARKLAILFDNTEIAASQVSVFLRAHGINLTDAAIGRHRRRVTKTGGSCICP
jgi:hypothetical protein